MTYPFVLGDVPFTLEPYVIYTDSGNRIVSSRKKMPIGADFLTHSVFYLYDSEDAAKESDVYGGTGFFVSVPGVDREYVYAVTAAHVIEYSRVIRANKNGGGHESIDLRDAYWATHETADIAVAAVDYEGKDYKTLPIPSWLFLQPQHLTDLTNMRFDRISAVSLGDVVFMLGRFISRAGKGVNIPTVRSGRIAAYPHPEELITIDTLSHPQEGFLVELRSYFGYSGSPVFWHSPMSQFTNLLAEAMSTRYGLQQVPSAPPNDTPVILLGLDVGDYQNDHSIYHGGEDTEATIKFTSGFTVVLPAWQILDVLNDEEFMAERQKVTKKRTPPKASTARPTSSRPNLTGKSFEDVLKQVSRRLLCSPCRHRFIISALL